MTTGTDSYKSKWLVYLLLVYFASYIISATFFQLRSDVPAMHDGSPIEYFTGGLLMMSSLISLLIAETHIGKRWQLLFWLAASAGLALLAMDEIFRLHEKTRHITGDDDHIKTLQWAVAGGVIYMISRFESSSSESKIAFVIGYVLHSIYLLIDLGDGDLFTAPFVTKFQLQTIEEFFELFSLTAYCIALVLFFTNARNLKSSLDR